MSYFRLFVLLWGRVDSNHRTLPRTDLQSVAIAAMRLPHCLFNFSKFASRWRDSNPRPRDYKSRALANWATSAGYNSFFQITHSRLSRLQRYNFFLSPQTFFQIIFVVFSQDYDSHQNKNEKKIIIPLLKCRNSTKNNHFYRQIFIFWGFLRIFSLIFK